MYKAWKSQILMDTIWKWLNYVTTNLYLNCTLCVTQYDTNVWIIMWYNSISSPLVCLSCECENNKEFNILIIVSIIWIKELELFIDLRNLIYFPLTANQEPSFMSKHPSHYLLHTCKYHPHSAHITLWEPTTTHLQSSYQLLVGRQREASASQSAWTTAAPTPIGSGITSYCR
jgi:hypothetical protein